jgi:hypothetical protein
MLTLQGHAPEQALILHNTYLYSDRCIFRIDWLPSSTGSISGILSLPENLMPELLGPGPSEFASGSAFAPMLA